ncbi:hypothetical protein C8T65DRAFT_41866 [Cerioporus squamosus]|nr:hypothetical protein C8T65DRAFT_41866 [Cerioporus squamosus]
MLSGALFTSSPESARIRLQVPISKYPNPCATNCRILSLDRSSWPCMPANRSETSVRSRVYDLGAPSFISHVSNRPWNLGSRPDPTHRSIGCLLQDQRPRSLVWSPCQRCGHDAGAFTPCAACVTHNATTSTSTPHIYGPSYAAVPSLPLPLHYQLPQCVASPPVAPSAHIVTGHMSRTTDRHPTVLLDSSNYLAGSSSPFQPWAPDVAGPSSSSNSSLSYPVPQPLKAADIHRTMARSPTKTGPLPPPGYAYIAPAIAQLPYPLHPADMRTVTSAHHASDWLPPQQAVPLPRGRAGTPASAPALE